MLDFTNKVAIITGGASGMGAATAREFTAANAKVILVDRNQPLAQDVADEIGATVCIGDVSDSAFCAQVIETALDIYGRVDILVNAAGIIVRADALNTSDEAWQKIMNVNVSGVFYMCRAALRPMKSQGSGAIINFGSIWGGVGGEGHMAYCATKGAVHQMTRAMAMDHARDGIRVNAVCPGEVNTPMLRSERANPPTAADLQKLADETIPMGRLAEPVEIARVVTFLASDQASYMTGALIPVDAGYTAR